MAWIIDIKKAKKMIKETDFPLGPFNWDKVLNLIKYCVKEEKETKRKQ